MDFRHALLGIACDIFEHHDGVIDDDTDDERKPQHGEAVDGEAEEVEGDERAHDGGRNGEQHIERCAPGTQEEEADERRQDDGADELVFQLFHRIFDEFGGVKNGHQLQVHAFRKKRQELLDALLDVFGHLHGVRPALLDDTQSDRLLSSYRMVAEVRYAANIAQAVFHRRNFAEPKGPVTRGAAHAIGDDEFGELLWRIGFAIDSHVKFFGSVVDVAGWDVGMFRRNGV